MITLHPHQSAYIDKLRVALRDCQSVLAQSATGSGKTVIASQITRSASLKQRRVIFTVHRKELITQTAKTFDKFGIDYGIIASGISGNPYMDVQIASIDTLKRRLHKSYPCDLLIPDESHLAMADGWKKVIAHYMDRGSKVIGLSGSPCRLDGRGLGDLFQTMVQGPPISWLIENKFLSDYEIYAPSMPDMTGVHSRMGDFVQSENEAVMDTPSITGNAIEHYLKHSNERRAICFCVSVKHSRHTAEQFTASGIPAAHIDGSTPKPERRKIIEAFADGRILVLCNVEIVTTGFDLSAQVDRDVPVSTVILLRPTQSLALYLQMVGRGLRYKPFPAIILDHAGNAMRHGLPCEDREWTLDGSTRRRKKSDQSDQSVDLKQCPNCFKLHKPCQKCPKCGHEYPAQPRQIEEREGELQKIDKDAAIRAQRRIQGRAQTIQELVALGHSEGRARHIIAAREEKAQLRRTLINIYRVNGLNVSASDVMRLKPKELRKEIEKYAKRG